MRIWPRKKSSKQPEPRQIPLTVWLTDCLLEQTAAILQQSGELGRPHEGVAYWAGRRAGGEYFITTCIAPPARTTYGSFDTSSETNARVVMFLAKAGLELLAQVHSHPGSFVDHSDGDDELALMPYDGFLSIIVPHYARTGMHPLTNCGVHVFDHSRFCRLTHAEVEKSFRIMNEIHDMRP